MRWIWTDDGKIMMAPEVSAGNLKISCDAIDPLPQLAWRILAFLGKNRTHWLAAFNSVEPYQTKPGALSP